MNRLKLYAILSIIIFISIVLSISISIFITESRTSGISFGQIAGVIIGNLIYSILFNRDHILVSFLKWILVCVIIATLVYFSINYLGFEYNMFLMFVLYLLPSIVAWEVVTPLIKKIKPKK